MKPKLFITASEVESLFLQSNFKASCQANSYVRSRTLYTRSKEPLQALSTTITIIVVTTKMTDNNKQNKSHNSNHNHNNSHINHNNNSPSFIPKAEHPGQPRLAFAPSRPQHLGFAVREVTATSPGPAIFCCAPLKGI